MAASRYHLRVASWVVGIVLLLGTFFYAIREGVLFTPTEARDPTSDSML